MASSFYNQKLKKHSLLYFFSQKAFWSLYLRETGLKRKHSHAGKYEKISSVFNDKCLGRNNFPQGRKTTERWQRHLTAIYQIAQLGRVVLHFQRLLGSIIFSLKQGGTLYFACMTGVTPRKNFFTSGTKLSIVYSIVPCSVRL